MENFSNIAGHEFAKKFILSSLKKNRIAHAYLFAGPEAVGKFKFAVEFAKIIQCGIGYADNADQKIAARAAKIESGADPDVLMVDNSFSKNTEDEDSSAAERSFSVADVRKIEHHLSLSPYQSKYKIAIIRNAHLFTAEAANAFLKTMEEPRGDSIIILIADNINFLPKTLLSRVQMIRFGSARDSVIVDFLRENGASAEEAERIARVSGGKAGAALDFLKDPEKLLDYAENEKEWQKFISGTLNEKFGVIEKLANEEGRSTDVLDLWLGYSRDCLIGKYLFSDHASGTKKSFSPSKELLLKFIDRLTVVLKLLKSSNISKKLALENLALEI